MAVERPATARGRWTPEGVVDCLDDRVDEVFCDRWMLISCDTRLDVGCIKLTNDSSVELDIDELEKSRRVKRGVYETCFVDCWEEHRWRWCVRCWRE